MLRAPPLGLVVFCYARNVIMAHPVPEMAFSWCLWWFSLCCKALLAMFLLREKAHWTASAHYKYYYYGIYGLYLFFIPI